MNLLRLMLTTLVLLAQAWPLHAAVVKAPQAAASCEMGCCAAVAEMALCPCGEASQAPAAPAGLPPGAGRDLVPQATWVAAEEAVIPERACEVMSGGGSPLAGLHHPSAPPVRRAVLFCSFLN